ncbi:hypothetical protein [Vibrio minamisatsumaniensis]|uniref:hypothetical protein n=1 Tax=Vibrio minamisatsumaniensis TaxID=2910243 RepID=UPI003D25799D
MNELTVEAMDAKLTLKRPNHGLVFIQVGDGLIVQAAERQDIKLRHLPDDGEMPDAYIMRAGDTVYHLERYALTRIGQFLEIHPDVVL